MCCTLQFVCVLWLSQVGLYGTLLRLCVSACLTLGWCSHSVFFTMSVLAIHNASLLAGRVVMMYMLLLLVRLVFPIGLVIIVYIAYTTSLDCCVATTVPL